MIKLFKPCFLACLAVLVVAAGWGSAVAFGTTLEMQTFDTAASAAAAGWVGHKNTGTDPPLPSHANLGWQDSNNAGGPGSLTGEAGGLMPWRSQTVRWYADTDLGGSLDESMALHAEFKFVHTQEQSYGGQYMIGWFDQHTLEVDPQGSPTYGIVPDYIGVGILVENPDKAFMGSAGQAREGTRPRVITPGTQYVFELDYDPNGYAASRGKLTVTVTEAANPANTWTTDTPDSLAWPQAIAPWNGSMMDLNAFGLLSADDNSASFGALPYMDDATYTVVPEPAMPVLLLAAGIGLAICWTRRRFLG
jgi:hypothetical protein